MGIEQGTPSPEAPKQEQPQMITFEDVPLDPETRARLVAEREAHAALEREAAQRLVEGGRFGMGIVENVPMPANPNKVPGWNGERAPEVPVAPETPEQQ